MSERHRIRPTLIGVVAVMAVVAAALVVTELRLRASGSTPASNPTSAASGYIRLVLHNGDRVRAAGRVIAAPQERIRFCDLSGPQEATAHSAPPTCPSGVDIAGVDLAQLDNRQVMAGVVTGTATVTGVWRNETIVVSTQSRAPSPTPVGTGLPLVPCSAPKGGWPSTFDHSFSMNPVSAYGRAHPGAVVEPALLRDADGHAVAYVLTSQDPAPIADALAKFYGKNVCVRRSLHTRSQLDAACQAMLPSPPRPHFEEGSCDGLDLRAQLHVDVHTTWVDQTEANLAAAQPAGLVRLSAWLRPLA